MGVGDCGSALDGENCQDVMDLLVQAEEHIIYVLQINEKNGCMTCFLSNALESARYLDSIAKSLYAMGYPGANRIEGRASFRVSDMMDNYCPDLNGRWYPDNDLNVSILIDYKPGYDLFEAQLSDGTTTEVSYVQIIKYDRVRLHQQEIYGTIYNQGNTIDWGNHRWIRDNNTIDGRWSMDGSGDTFQIVRVANGQYRMIVESVPTASTFGITYVQGDLFGEFWTQDFIHFEGYINTKIPNSPQQKIYLKMENGLFYINDTMDVYNDKQGATIMSKR